MSLVSALKSVYGCVEFECLAGFMALEIQIGMVEIQGISFLYCTPGVQECFGQSLACTIPVCSP